MKRYLKLSLSGPAYSLEIKLKTALKAPSCKHKVCVLSTSLSLPATKAVAVGERQRKTIPLLGFPGREQTRKHSQNNKQAFINSAIHKSRQQSAGRKCRPARNDTQKLPVVATLTLSLCPPSPPELEPWWCVDDSEEIEWVRPVDCARVRVRLSNWWMLPALAHATG